MRALAIALAITLGAATAAGEGDRVRGAVVGVTATEVFIDLGERAGLHAGDEVVVEVGVERVALELLDVGPGGARAALPADAPLPRIGDRVSAAARPPAARDGRPERRPPAPDAADVVDARWAGVDRGRPRRIAYRGATAATAGGRGDAARAVRGALAVDYLGIFDLRSGGRDPYHRVHLRSNLDVAPAAVDWLDYSHRIRLRLDVAPGGGLRYPGARDALVVYRLRAGLDAGALRAELGRTPAGSFPGAGLVDGAAVRYRVLPALYVGAFGGASPDLLDLAPGVDALRFGAYASTRAAGSGRDPLRLSADLGVVATTFDGELDRRALGARAAAAGRAWWASAQTLIDFHPAAEPSMFVVDAGHRWGRWLRLSAGFDHVRATRTRQALATLPPGVLPSVAFTSARGGAALDLGRRATVDARAGWRWEADGVSALWYGGSLRLASLALRDDRLTLGGDGFVGSYQDGASGHVGYALPVHPRVDLDAGYRITTYRYGGENEQLWRHTVELGLDAWMAPGTTLQLRADAYLGDEERVVAAFASTAFRF